MLFQGFDSLRVAAETFYSGLHDFTLVSIPMFVMMGAAIGSSPAGKDLYDALDRWLYRVPGGLVISNLGACAHVRRADRLVAGVLRRHRQDGHSGDAQARLSGRGRDRLDLRRRHARHPDPAVDHLHPLRHRHRDLDRPAVPRRRHAGPDAHRRCSCCGRCSTSGSAASAPTPIDFRYRWKEKFQSIPKIAPFLLIIVGVMYVLYGGVATPSEAAGVGAALCVILAVVIYRMWTPEQWWEILRDTTRESVMILMIIATAVLFSYMLTSLYITQTLAQAIADAASQQLGADAADQHLPAGLRLLHPAGGHHPDDRADPAADHHRRRLRPGLVRRHRDHQHGNRPDHPAGRAQYLHRQRDRARRADHARCMWGSVPYVLCMMLAIVILCIFPEIATWLPDHLMGPGVPGMR